MREPVAQTYIAAKFFRLRGPPVVGGGDCVYNQRASITSLHGSLRIASMTPERWKQVDQLLQQVLEHAPDAGAAFLAEVCGEDEELRREVESLLVFHERAGNLIE